MKRNYNRLVDSSVIHKYFRKKDLELGVNDVSICSHCFMDWVDSDCEVPIRKLSNKLGFVYTIQTDRLCHSCRRLQEEDNDYVECIYQLRFDREMKKNTSLLCLIK